MNKPGVIKPGVSGPGLIGRWSRRKAATVRGEPAVPSEALPDVATLGAGSDYTAFLQAGVPRALQVQALSVAWASDPAIAGFRGMAEYDWDFNATGYGRLAAGDNVARLLHDIVTPIARPAPTVAPEEPVTVRVPEPRVAVLAEPEPLVEAVEIEEARPVVVRRHGGALPV